MPGLPLPTHSEPPQSKPAGLAFLASCSLEAELIDRCTWRTDHEARVAIFSYLETFYNRARRHSALDYLSPTEFERRYAAPAESIGS